MRIYLVGADFEENLGVGAIAAAAEQAGHRAEIAAFNYVGETRKLAARIAAEAPEVVGLSIQFQHRVYEFLGLAAALRRAGYRGHITCGGQFPSLAWAQTLESVHGVDSVVLYEGERTIVDLLAALQEGRRLFDVPGLALRGDDGAPMRTAPRALVHDLDELPLPRRYRGHSRHVGIPFIPVMAGRGCWEACSYCSITAFYRDARANGGGKLYRHRSPQHVAEELAVLWHRAGGTGIFCFHDDNFLLPSTARSLERVREMKSALERLGVSKLAIVGKSRPDCIDAELAVALRELGVVRLYIGVENASEGGAYNLLRGAPAKQADRALAACRSAGIFVCYNLLLFEPDATLDNVHENIAFIRKHAHYPVNFCRAEPYFGTPLHQSLEAERALRGSYLGFDYRVRDDAAELLFRICAAAFRQRNFAADGVANRYMGAGYAAKVLEQFYPQGGSRLRRLVERAEELTRGISLETADFLEEAVALAREPGTEDHLLRRTADLGMRVAAADARWHDDLDDLYADMQAFSEAPPTRALPLPASLVRVARSMLLSASVALAASATACSSVVDPVPSDSGFTDARDATQDTVDVFVVDPPPPDAARDAGQDSADVFVVDPPPPDAARDASQDSVDVFVVDPPPPDAGVTDTRSEATVGSLGPDEVNDLFHWTDSSPRQAQRARELPLFDPPRVRLQASADASGEVRVAIRGLREPAGTRWEAAGEVSGEGTEVAWRPESPRDLLRVAVRTRGGIAVLELRAKDVGRENTSLV